MLKIFTRLFFYIVFSTLFFQLRASGSLTINILSRELYNGAGKEVDVETLKEELEKLGHSVNCFEFLANKDITPADINLFLAKFDCDLFPKAKLNWLLVNPDFCYGTLEELKQFDLILCKTEESVRIFQPINDIYYLGFTSRDCYIPSIPKIFSQYLHLAGKSPLKGTEEIIETWKSRPEFPELICIQRPAADKAFLPSHIHFISNRIASDSLLKLQNGCGIHLCPSKTEGFGHSLVEGMSAGAVIVTTDAPPMNEFIKDPRCLIKYKASENLRYAIAYTVDEIELAQAIIALQQLSDEELQEIGQKNRIEFLKRKIEFKQNLKNLIDKTILHLG